MAMGMEESVYESIHQPLRRGANGQQQWDCRPPGEAAGLYSGLLIPRGSGNGPCGSLGPSLMRVSLLLA